MRLALTTLPTAGIGVDVFDLAKDPAPNHEFTEHMIRRGEGTALVIIAPHGAGIEPYTDLQAEHVVWQLAHKGQAAQCWACKGYLLGSDPDATFDRWHITSTDISRPSFPLLDAVMSSPFARAVSFHGFTPRCTPEGWQPDILIGGGAAGTGPGTMKKWIRDEIEDTVAGFGFSVDLETGDELGGGRPHNIVNRLAPMPANDPSQAGNGVQIEQSYAARACCWREIARAVTRVCAEEV